MHASLSDLLARQGLVVARRQLLAAGISAPTVDRYVAAGDLALMHRGVYRLACAPLTWELRLRAALLLPDSLAAVSHRAAASVLDIGPSTSLVELVAPAGGGRRSPGIIVHRAPLTSTEIAVVRGLAVTKPARTLIDLAAVLSPEELGVAIDRALSQRLVSCAYLRGRVTRYGTRGRPGMRALAAALAERADGKPLGTSAFERELFMFLRAQSLPRPVAQYEVRLASGRRRYLDYAYPWAMLALEAHSFRHHAGKTAWSKDSMRNAELIAEGWRVLLVTHDSITTEAVATAQVIRRALGVAA